VNERTLVVFWLALGASALGGCPGTNTPADSGSGGVADALEVRSDAPLPPGVDAGPMCSESVMGWCTGGLTCLGCPAGPIMDHYLCTTSCASNADCTDPARPTCSMDMFGGGAGLCVPTGFGCAWGAVCASPDTLIATPSGERRIDALLPGDLVYSEHHGMLRPVPLRSVSRTPVFDHRVARVTLATGRILEISPGHPTADGRFFSDLRAGDVLDGVTITDVSLVPFVHAFTHDILPDSDTGTYVAGGALIGSTLSD